MNMGGPGDHWYTDVFCWDRPAFGEPIDSLLRDVKKYGGDTFLRDGQPLARRLSALWWPLGAKGSRELGGVTAELQALRNQLRADTEAGGWEVD